MPFPRNKHITAKLAPHQHFTPLTYYPSLRSHVSLKRRHGRSSFTVQKDLGCFSRLLDTYREILDACRDGPVSLALGFRDVGGFFWLGCLS